MTHKQIWTEIAKAFLTPEKERGLRQKNLTMYGLCNAKYGWERNQITKFICSLKRTWHGYWLPIRFSFGHTGLYGRHKREHDLIRGDMAMLFSCMTSKEFNKLLAPTGAQQKKGEQDGNSTR